MSSGRSTLQRLRMISLTEGVSFVLLLFVAMPLKYFADQPMAVKIVGWIHGVLFMGLGFATLHTMKVLGWPFSRGLKVVVAGLLPFGPFVIDPRLRAAQEEQDRRTGGEGALSS